MKKKLSMLLVSLLAVVLAFALVACGGGKLTISDESLALTVGDTKQLTLKEGETDVSKDAEWTTSDEKVVTVSTRGNVSARAAGTATVTGTYKGKSATCTVSVKAKEVVTVTITDEAGKEVKALTVDRNATVNVKATTSNGSKVSWSVSDTKFATVEETGDNAATITGKYKTPDGSPVTVYATSGSARAEVAVTVTYTNAPADYYDLAGPDDNGSIGQNKVTQGKWAYWADMPIWNTGSVDIEMAEYLGAKEGSQAGTVHFKYNASSFGNYPDSCVQLTYRYLYDETDRPDGLKTAGYYKLTCKITSDAAGTVNLNGTDVELKVGDNNVTVYFQHNDTTTVYGPTVYDNIYYTAVFLTAGQKLPAAELTLTDFKWEEFTPQTLKTPTVTVADGKVTISDDNAENAASYNLGLFDGDRQIYVVPGAKKGENTVDLSMYEEGEYTVKAQAVGGDARYVTSGWSDGNAKLNVTHGGKTEYDVIEGTEPQAKQFPGLWYYSSEYGGLKDVKYANKASSAETPYGEVSFEITDGGSWYSNQFFFVNSRLVKERYIVKFTIVASEMEGEGNIHINGQVVTIKNGENHIEYRINQDTGVTTVSIQMGEPTANYQDTVKAIAKGKFTLKDFSYTVVVPEKLATPTKLEVAEDGTVKITDAEENKGKVSEYKVFFCDAEGNVKRTKLVANGGKINLNSIPNGTYYLKVAAAGDKIDWLDSAPSSILVGDFKVEHGTTDLDLGAGGEGTCEDDWVYWASAGEKGCNVTVSEAKYSINADETISISAKFSVTGATLDYGFQLFHNDKTNFPNGTNVKVTLTATLNIDGTISLCGQNIAMTAGEAKQLEVTRVVNYTGSWEGQTLFAMNVKCEADKSYELTLKNIKFEKVEAPAPAGPDALTAGGEGDAKTANDGWKYWHAKNERNWTTDDVYATVEVTEAKREEGVITLKFKGKENWLDYGFQLFYNDPATYPVGSQYKLTLRVKATYACTVTFNDKKVELAAGDEKDIEVTFTYNFHLDNVVDSNYGISLFDMQVKTEQGKDYELTLSNIKWEKVESQKPQPGTKYTPNYTLTKNSESDMANDVWAYWFVEAENWNCGAVVTMNQAEGADNAITLDFSTDQANAWWFAVQLFYKNTQMMLNVKYTLTFKINVSVDCKVTIMGVVKELTAGDNTVSVDITPTTSTVFSLQFGTNPEAGGTGFSVAACKAVISEVEWTVAGEEQPEPPAGATQMTKVSSAAEATEAGKWYYYAKENVTVTKAEVAADGTITFIFSGATAWDDVQIFYTPVGANAGETWNLNFAIKFDYESEVGAFTVSLNNTDNTTPGYGKGTDFPSQGFNFTKGGTPLFQMTLGKEGVANPTGTITLTFKINSANKI